MRIIIAHPGRQHSYRLASALKKSGDLLFYCTTIYDKNTSILMKIIKKFLSKDNLKRANKRRNLDLNDNEVIQIGELGGLLETLLVRLDKTHIIYEKVRNFNADRFGIKVAKLAIEHNADMVIMYDSNATKAFEFLKKNAPQIKRILDVSIAVRPYLKDIYTKEMEKSHNNDLYLDNKSWWKERAIKKLYQEINDADYFLTASSFVDESLRFCNIQQKQILRVPYGANVSSSFIHGVNLNKPLDVLYVGQVTYRKGITYLLKAISEMDSKNIRITIVGAYNSSDWFVKKYINKENISFIGLVTPDKMEEIYAQSDVFVIASIAEGMAQVGIEAMACGLPVICSHNSGIDDIVENEKSGFIIPCCDVESLKEKLQFFIDNREKTVEMGERGRIISKEYTWEKYERNVVATLHHLE